MHRYRRRQHASGAGHQHPCGEPRLLLGREPLPIGGEGSHQRTRDARPHQRAPEPQGREPVGKRERAASQGGHTHQHRIHSARAEPVEPDAERQLHRGEGEEVGARQGAELCVAQADLGDQVGREHRVDRTQPVRHVVPGREASEDAQGQQAARRAGGCFGPIGPAHRRTSFSDSRKVVACSRSGSVPSTTACHALAPTPTKRAISVASRSRMRPAASISMPDTVPTG